MQTTPEEASSLWSYIPQEDYETGVISPEQVMLMAQGAKLRGERPELLTHRQLISAQQVGHETLRVV